VLIHGMGGLGKSSLAARLCDRLPEFERLVWVGRVDEPNLVNKLAVALDSRELREELQDNKEELKFRLRRVFRQLEDEAAKPFLLVLDDFEANLEPRNDGYVLQPEAANVLEALVWAIGDTYAPHRLILTCRYDFESTPLRYFYKQPLDGMRGADLRKKCSRLSAFDAKSQVDEALQVQAKRLADGNPRLLQWLNKVLLNLDPPQPPLKRGEQNTVAEILARLEADPVELREQVLAVALLAQMDQPLEEMLRRGLVFELPVPREAIAAVCESIPNLEQQINRAVALGLLEVSPDESLRVPRILPLKLPEDAETLHKQGAEVLYRLWWQEAEWTSEEQGREIHRLALKGKAEKIAVEVADILTDRWICRRQFREVVKVCQDTLELASDTPILFLRKIARSQKNIGEVSKAFEYYQKALDLCTQEHEQQKAFILAELAALHVEQENFDEAIALYQQSSEIYKSKDNFGERAAVLSGLAVCEEKQGKIKEAIALYMESLRLCDESIVLFLLKGIGNLESKEETLYISNLQGKARTLLSLGQLLEKDGDLETALHYLQKSLELFHYLQSPEAETAWEAIARVQQMAENRG
jgi:tetratricopeptide (TPR) repeat protein